MISDVPIIQLDSKWAKRDEAQRITLVLDIDGTLIEGDTTRKATKKYIKKHFCGSFFNTIKGIIAFIGLMSIGIILLLGFTSSFFPLIGERLNQFLQVLYLTLIYSLISSVIISTLLWKHTKLFIKFPLQSTRAKYKQELAKEITLTEDDIKFIPNTIKLIQQERERNRPIFLATGADQKYAEMIRDALQKKLGFTKRDQKIRFIASTGKENLIGKNKAFVLIKEFGRKSFIYAGNSGADLNVWEYCINPIIVVKGNHHGTLKALLKAEKDVQVIH